MSSFNRVTIKPSQAFNKCGIRNYLLYIPAFKNRDDTTVENVIPHWTDGLKSFFIIPQQFDYEWFCYLVSDVNEPDMEYGTSATHKVYRDGDSFIQNVLTPNVVQICQNVCIPRGSVDGSLIEMFIAGAKMSTSEAVLKTWQTLVRETIKQNQNKEEAKEEMEEETEEEDECSKDPTCDFYRDDSYSQSTATTDCSGDPIYNSDIDSD